MTDYNDFDSFRSLPIEVLDEVVREGEDRLQSQFEAASASDQRAMTWCGFLVAVSTASFGGAVGLILRDEHTFLSGLATIFGVLLFIASWLAMDAVRPSKFAFPGNEPKNWAPDQWHDTDPDNQNLKQARIEQAFVIQIRIAGNIGWADRTTSRLKLSMDIAVWSVLLVGIILFSYLIIQISG